MLVSLQREDEERVASITRLVTSLATGVIGIGPSSPLPPEPQSRGAFTDRFRDPARAALLQASHPHKPRSGSSASAAEDAARNAEMMRTMRMFPTRRCGIVIFLFFFS